MKTIEIAPEPAILLRYTQEEYHAYMQTYPFLSGPQMDLNRAIVDSLKDAIIVRNTTRSCKVDQLSEREVALPSEIETRARTLCKQAEMSDKEIENAFSIIAWKFRAIPPQVTNILDVGCGAGIELLFLRACAPEARIVAIDWVDKVSSPIKCVSRVEFQVRNVIEYLATDTEKFELIFSNHVLEHMYDPDRVLRLIRSRLNLDGRMIAGLPLDGCSGTAVEITNMKVKEVAAINVGDIDFGHPWKTTMSDLVETLVDSGFYSVNLTQRENHLNVEIVGNEKELTGRKKGKFLCGVVFGPMKAALVVVFGRNPPQPILRIYYALARRVWFGANNLKNTTAPEVLLTAH